MNDWVDSLPRGKPLPAEESDTTPVREIDIVSLRQQWAEVQFEMMKFEDLFYEIFELPKNLG